MLARFSIPTTGFSISSGGNSLPILYSDILTLAPPAVTYKLRNFVITLIVDDPTIIADFQVSTIDVNNKPFYGNVFSVGGGQTKVVISDSPIAPLMSSNVTSDIAFQIDCLAVSSFTLYYSVVAEFISSTPPII